MAYDNARYSSMMPPYMSSTDMRGGGYRTDDLSGYQRLHAPGLMVSSVDSSLFTYSQYVPGPTTPGYVQAGPYVFHHLEEAPPGSAASTYQHSQPGSEHPTGMLIVPEGSISYVFSGSDSPTRRSTGSLRASQGLRASNTGSSKAAWGAGPGIRRPATYMQLVTHSQEQALHDKLRGIQQQIRNEELEAQRLHKESLMKRSLEWKSTLVENSTRPSSRRHTDGSQRVAAPECQVLTAAQVEQMFGRKADTVKLISEPTHQSTRRPRSPAQNTKRWDTTGGFPAHAPPAPSASHTQDTSVNQARAAPPAPSPPPPTTPVAKPTPAESVTVLPRQPSPPAPAAPAANIKETDNLHEHQPPTPVQVPAMPTAAPVLSDAPRDVVSARPRSEAGHPQPDVVILTDASAAAYAKGASDFEFKLNTTGAAAAAATPHLPSESTARVVELPPAKADSSRTPDVSATPTPASSAAIPGPAPAVITPPQASPAAPVFNPKEGSASLAASPPPIPAPVAAKPPAADVVPVPLIAPAHQPTLPADTPQAYQPPAPVAHTAREVAQVDKPAPLQVQPAQQAGDGSLPSSPYPQLGHADSPVMGGASRHGSTGGLRQSVGSRDFSDTYILSPSSRRSPGSVGRYAAAAVPSCVVQGQPLPPVPQLRDYDLSHVPGSPKSKGWSRRTYKLERPVPAVVHAAPSPARVAEYVNAYVPPWSAQALSIHSSGPPIQPLSPSGSVDIQLRNGAVIHAPVWDPPVGGSAGRSPTGTRSPTTNGTYHDGTQHQNTESSTDALLKLLQAIKQLKGSSAEQYGQEVGVQQHVAAEEPKAAITCVPPAIPWSAVERKRAALAGALVDLEVQSKAAESCATGPAKLPTPSCVPPAAATPGIKHAPTSTPDKSHTTSPANAGTTKSKKKEGGCSSDSSSSDDESTSKQKPKGKEPVIPTGQQAPGGTYPSLITGAPAAPPPQDVLSVPYSTLHPTARLDTALAEVLRPPATGAVAQVFSSSQRPVPQFDGTPVRTSMRKAWGSQAQGEQRSHLLKEAEAVMAEKQAEQDAREQALAEGAEMGLSQQEVDQMLEEERQQQEADIKRVAKQAERMRAEQASEAPAPLSAEQRRREERRIQQDYQRGSQADTAPQGHDSGSDDEPADVKAATQPATTKPVVLAPPPVPPYGTYATPAQPGNGSVTLNAITHERTVRDRLLHLEHQAHNMKQSGAWPVQPLAWAAADKEMARIASNMDNVAEEDREERQALAERQAEAVQQAEEERQVAAKAFKADAAAMAAQDDEAVPVKAKEAPGKDIEAPEKDTEAPAKRDEAKRSSRSSAGSGDEAPPKATPPKSMAEPKDDDDQEA